MNAIVAPARAQGSLRSKALLAFAVFAIYLAITGFIVSVQRSKVTDVIIDLEEIHHVEAMLGSVNTVAANLIIRLDEAPGGDLASSVEAMGHDVQAVVAGVGGLGPWYPRAGPVARRLEVALQQARAEPSRAELLEMLAVMRTLVADLNSLARDVRNREHALWGEYRNNYHLVTLTASALFIAGLFTFGGVALFAITRISWDVRTLATRAVEIVRGYRGPPLAVTRRDEIGMLMDSVNRMQQALRERESEIEVVRQQKFHQEKMVAIGSLAAAVAHEINNPIAAIEGVAQAIHDVRSHDACGKSAACYPQLILEHTRRIVGITRQLSEMASPRSREPEWTDLNALVRSTSTFVSFDPRFRGVRMDLELDMSIPAVWAVADHLAQTLMNLLINAADALKEQPEPRAIRLATSLQGDFVRLVVSDTGPGMSAEVLARAFEEGYTTKATGSGIGLFMCKTLVELGHGRIDVKSAPGQGTQVTVLVPQQAPVTEATVR